MDVHIAVVSFATVDQQIGRKKPVYLFRLEGVKVNASTRSSIGSSLIAGATVAGLRAVPLKEWLPSEGGLVGFFQRAAGRRGSTPSFATF